MTIPCQNKADLNGVLSDKRMMESTLACTLAHLLSKMNSTAGVIPPCFPLLLEPADGTLALTL